MFKNSKSSDGIDGIGIGSKYQFWYITILIIAFHTNSLLPFMMKELITARSLAK